MKSCFARFLPIAAAVVISCVLPAFPALGAEAVVGDDSELLARLSGLESALLSLIELASFGVGLFLWRLAVLSFSRRNLF